MNRSEWEHAYLDVRVTGRDVEFAVVIVSLYALIALIA
jgi:hypothetical protein